MSLWSSWWDAVQETVGEMGQTLADTRDSLGALIAASEEEEEDAEPLVNHYHGPTVLLEESDTTSLDAAMSRNHQALAQRGEKLTKMETTVDRLQSASSQTVDLARQVRESQQAKSASTDCSCTLL